MSSERAEQPAAPDNNPHGVPGKALAAQREAMGWTVEQVADQLKLAVRQVVALEAGDYEHLPSPAVTRGFVRAYAKLMKMDPVPLVAQIAMDTPPAPDNSAAVTRRASPASFSASKFPSHGKRSSLPVGWIAGGAVAIVAIAAAWHFGLVPHRSESAEGAAQTATAPAAAPASDAAGPAASAPAASATNGSAVETLQNPAVPLISVPGPNGAPAANAPAPANSAPNAAANPTAPARPPVQLASTATVPAAAPAAAAPAPVAATAATAGANALVLNVREDSWIQVTPAKGGAALISRLVKGGSTETVNVDQPVRVIVGNPTAVSATLRGNAVALPPVPGKTISRINLQ